MEYVIDLKGDGYSAAYEVTSEGMVTAGDGKVRAALLEGLVGGLQLLVSDERVAGTHGNGVYVGMMGVGIALDRVLKLGIEVPAGLKEQMKSVRQEILHVDAGTMKRDPTYLEGKAGVLAVQSLHFADNERYVDHLLSLARSVLTLPPTECELLYGRAGYLYALLTVAKVMPAKYEGRYNDIVGRLVRHLLQQGTEMSASLKRSGAEPIQTLMYKWHEKVYYGAAHGVAGILHTLLQCPLDFLKAINPVVLPSIESTLKELTLLELPNSNYPSSLGKGGRLVQFCHGAPGFILLFCRAYEVFEDPMFLAKAERAGNFLKNNIKTKGVGLCHGVAGSLYALLALYRVTHKIQWLQYTLHVAMYMSHEYTRFYRVSDRPMSLYEGVAGMTCVLADLLTDPMHATMPGFDI